MRLLDVLRRLERDVFARPGRAADATSSLVHLGECALETDGTLRSLDGSVSLVMGEHWPIAGRTTRTIHATQSKHGEEAA